MAERKRRREQKKKIMVQHSTKISEQVSDALYDISQKYDVSLMKIMQKFIEDGIRNLAQSQGWSELLVVAGLEERVKPNPFEPIGSPAPVKETWTPAPQERFIPPDLPVDEFFPLPSGVGPKVGE